MSTNKVKNSLEKLIYKKLGMVIDPELYISIVDLGLIYGGKVRHNSVSIDMTLTTIGCPLFSILEKDIKGKVSEVKGVKNVDVNLKFDPPWSLERMSEKARAQLGI